VEKATSEEIAAAKQAAREEGNTNVFEAMPQAVIKKTAKALTKKEAATEVKLSTMILSGRLTNAIPSTNTRQQTSKSRTGS
jgi:hypothetical protein